MIQKVVFMGTPDFAVGTLEALVREGYEVLAVFSQPDKPKGRKKELAPTPVKAAAERFGLPVYQPERIRDPKWLTVLQDLNPDVIVVVAFGQLIPRAILELPKYGCINVHASLLPKYRGAAPIQWAVINGEEESGVTTMRMDAGLDTGDMILKETVRLDEKETGGSLFEKLSAVGAQLLVRTLKCVGDGTVVYEKQPEESPTPYAAMLKKEMGRIDWTKCAREIECLIRGLDPWPSAYTIYRGKTLKLWAAAVVEDQAADLKRSSDLSLQGKTNTAEGRLREELCGTVAFVSKQALWIRTGSGLLSLREVQPEGKKRMTIDAFLRGYPVETGELLG